MESSSSSSTSNMAGHEPLNAEKTNSRTVADDPNSLEPVQSRIDHFHSRPREIIFIVLICMAQLMTQAALGQAIVPLHIIGDSFGTSSPGQLSKFLYLELRSLVLTMW